MGVLAELLKLGMKTAVKQADEVVPRAVSKVDDQLLNLKYTRETPKTKGEFSAIDLITEGKITDKEARGGLFNPYTFKNKEMIVGPDASNLNTSRIEISTFDPASTPGPKGFGMKAADDIGLPADAVGNETKTSMKVKANLIEGSQWKWYGKPPEGFENNTHLVTIEGGPKLKKAVGENLKISEGPSDHAYATKVIYEKGGNLSTYDTRAARLQEQPLERTNKIYDYLKKKDSNKDYAREMFNKDYKDLTTLEKELVRKAKRKESSRLDNTLRGQNPKGRPTTVGTPEFGTKIGDILKGKIKHPVYDQIIMREEGGQVLPVIKREAGGGGMGNEAEAAAAYDDYTSTYGYGTGADLGNAGGSNDGTYNLSQLEALNKADDPSKGNANTDDYGPGGLFDLGYNPQELKDIRAARQAAYRQDELDKQNEGNGDIPYLSGNTRYDTTRSQYAQGPLTSQQINENLIYNLLDRSKAQKDYEKRKGDWLTTLVRTGRATPQEKAELETLKSSTYKYNPEDFKAGDKGREEREEALNDVDRAAGYLKGGFAPLQTGGQVLEGLDREYMRQRNSKEKVEGMMGILPIQPRQYGGGLDDAYMNRRSAFAAPDANSAFASPMGRGDLPTMYRQEGGDIPITSVNGQGIRRVIYRESGGGLPTIYRANGGDFDFMDSYNQADIDAAMADPTDDGLGGVGGDGGLPGGSPAPAAPLNSDDQDEEYLTTLFGKGKERADNLKAFGDMNTPQDLGTGGPGNLSQQDYIQRLNKEGFPEWSVPYYNSLKNRGMTNDQATAALAAAMSTPGGLAGMQNAYAGDYSYGGAFGTMQDLLEKGLDAEFDIDNELADDKDIKAYNKDDDEEFLSEAELNGKGLLDFATSIQDKLSIQSDLTPTTMALIEAKAKEAGLDPQPVNSFMAGLIDYGIPLLAGLPGTIAKGLSNMTGAGRTIMTVTKDGLQYNLSDTGKFSLNTEPTAPDYGNDEEPKKRSKPIEEKITETVTEDKPLTGMAGLLAKRDEPISRKASNKYSRDLLDSLGYGNVNIG